MNFKKTNYKLHLWLGLPASIIAFFICLSGSIFVFSDEIINIANCDISVVTPQKQQISIDKQVKIIKDAYPKHILLNCINYKEKNKATLFVVGSKKTGLTYVYVNPYTGKIIGENKLICLFSKVAHFHKQLLLKKPGAWIVLITSLVFVIELITGLVMWWPKNKSKKYFKNSLTIKRNTRPLRRMIDLHRVFGLYFLVVLFIISITGVALFFLPHQGIEAQKHNQQSAQINSNKQPLTLDELVLPLLKESNVLAIKTDLWNINKSTQIQCIAGKRFGVVSFTGTPYLIDKYTGKRFTDTEQLKELKTRNIFRKIHVGDWMGWFGKLITFFSGLIGAFLAVSGIIIWGKKKF